MQIPTVFGMNFLPIIFTYQLCTVSLLLEKLPEKMNIPICSAGTAYTLGSGETVILVFGKGLLFGNRMYRLLINPNQCRYYGILV